MPLPAASLWLGGLDPRNRVRGHRANVSRLVHSSITLAIPAFPGILVPPSSTSATESLRYQQGAVNPLTAMTTAQCPSTWRRVCSPTHSPPIIDSLSVLEPDPVVARAQSAPSSIASGPPHEPVVDDPVARLWEAAVKKYNASAGVGHSSDGALLFSNKADIDDYVRDQEAQFKKFRDDGPQFLRERLLPVANVLGKLCDGIGNSLAPVGLVVYLAAVGPDFVDRRRSLPVQSSSRRSDCCSGRVGSHPSHIAPTDDAAGLDYCTRRVRRGLSCVRRDQVPDRSHRHRDRHSCTRSRGIRRTPRPGPRNLWSDLKNEKGRALP